MFYSKPVRLSSRQDFPPKTIFFHFGRKRNLHLYFEKMRIRITFAIIFLSTILKAEGMGRFVSKIGCVMDHDSWLSSLYCPLRNSDRVTIEQTHPTLPGFKFKPSRDEDPEKLYAVCLKALEAVCLVPTNPAESIVFGMQLLNTVLVQDYLLFVST